MEKFEIKKILVPFDFSQTAKAALEQAVLIAKQGNAQIKILHVIADIYRAFIPEEDPIMANNDPINQTLSKRAGSALQKIIKDLKKANDIPVEYEIKSGSINDTICVMAEKESFDLIVMGTHGTSGIREFFAGSNAYKVVHHSTCPVLTVQNGQDILNFKNIILPIRLERSSRQKVDYVVDLARLFGSTVFITGFTDQKDESKQNKINQYVAQVEKYLLKFDVKYKSKVIFAPNFVKEIIKHGKKNKAGLIVVMKEHDFSLDQLVKGSYAEQFVNHSPIPVLSIPVFSNPDLISFTPSLSGAAPY